MKIAWKTFTLEQVTKFERGLTYSKKDEVVHSKNIVLRANNINLRTNELDFTELKYISDNIIIPKNKKVLKDSLIICTASGSKSHLGKVALINQDYDFAFGGFMGQITPNRDVNPKFLFYLMTSPSYKRFIERLNDGVNINNLKFDDLKIFTFLLPPLPEQQRIVEILDQSFAAIEQAIANTKKNLQNAKDLFETYLQSIFSVKDNGWENKKIIQIASLRSGNSLEPILEKDKGELPYLKVADMNLPENEKYIITSSRFVNYSEINKHGVIPKGSTIFPKRGGAIYTNKKRLTSCEIWMDLNLMAVTPNSEILPLFMYYFFISIDLKKFSNGSSIPQINNYDIEPLMITYPDLQVQKIIIEDLENISKETQNLESNYKQKLQLLTELKQSILQKAFTGELT